MLNRKTQANMAGGRQFGGVGVNFLTEEGFYVLQKLTPAEVFQIICDLPDEPTEIRLAELKTELSPERLDEAVDSIIQEVYDDKDKSKDPFQADESRYIRKYTWKRVKKLYQKMKLFGASDEAAEMKKPTPRLESENTRQLRKKKALKIKKDCGLASCFTDVGDKPHREIPEAKPQPLKVPSVIPPKPVRLNKKILEEISDSVISSPQEVNAPEPESAEASAQIEPLVCEEAAENQPEPVEPQPENVVAEPQETEEESDDDSSPSQETEEESDDDSSPSQETCGAAFKAGAQMLKRSLEKIQRPTLPRMESGKACLEKIKAAGNKMLRKSSEKVPSAEEDVETLIPSHTESQPSETESTTTEVMELTSSSSSPGFRTLCLAKIRAGKQRLERRGKKRSPVETELLIDNLEPEQKKEIVHSIKLMAQKLQFYAENVKEYVQTLKNRSKKVKIVAVETEYQLKTATALLEDAAKLLEAANSSHAAEKLEVCTEKLKAWTTKLKSLAEEDEQKQENTCSAGIRARMQQVHPPNVKAFARTMDARRQACVESIKEKVKNTKSYVETNLLKSIYKNVTALIKVVMAHHRAVLTGILTEGTKRFLQPIKSGHLKLKSCGENLKTCAGRVTRCGKTTETNSGNEGNDSGTTTCIPRLCPRKPRKGSPKPESDEAAAMKAALKHSVLIFIAHIVSKSGRSQESQDVSFPVTDFVERIWEEVKDDDIRMDKAKIRNKLHKLVYNDLMKKWKQSQYLAMFAESKSSILNDIVVCTFKKYLKNPKKPSAFRRFLNFFHRKSD